MRERDEWERRKRWKLREEKKTSKKFLCVFKRFFFWIFGGFLWLSRCGNLWKFLKVKEIKVEINFEFSRLEFKFQNLTVKIQIFNSISKKFLFIFNQFTIPWFLTKAHPMSISIHNIKSIESFAHKKITWLMTWIQKKTPKKSKKEEKPSLSIPNSTAAVLIANWKCLRG